MAQWPQQIGYKNDWVTRETDWNRQGAFLDRVEMPESVELGLLAVRMVHVGDQNFYIIGGRRMDRNFLQALSLPAGMRALLYRNLENDFVPAALSSAEGPVTEPERFASLIESLQKTARFPQQVAPEQGATEQTIQWTADPASTEKFAAVPLAGRRGELLGALLLGSSQGGLVALLNYVRGLALVIGAGALLLGFLMSWWISVRVSQPLARLSGGISEVADGDWEARIEARSGGEIGQLLRSFNRMTDRLTEEHTRLLTVERVAAWREMARQLAGEIYAGIAPLQKAFKGWNWGAKQIRSSSTKLLAESLATLRLELRILQAAGEGLMDFSRPPEAHTEALRINELVSAAVKSFEPQFCAIGRPPITPELYLDEEVAAVRADPIRLRKAIDSLLYCTLVDMPAGGTLTIRTKQQGRMVHLVISDTGRGFEIENPERMFSMRPASGVARGAAKGLAIGEGLILAAVQAIVSDHGGRMSVESAPGAGTTFFLDIPAVAEKAPVRRMKSKAASPKLESKEIKALPAAAADLISESPTAEMSSEASSETASGQTSEFALEQMLESSPDLAAMLEPEETFKLVAQEIADFASDETVDAAELAMEAAMPEPSPNQMNFDLGSASEAEAPLEMQAEVKPQREMTDIEVAWQMLETMQIEGPVDASEQKTAAAQPRFLSEAPEPHPWDADGWSALEESPAVFLETSGEVAKTDASVDADIQSSTEPQSAGYVFVERAGRNVRSQSWSDRNGSELSEKAPETEVSPRKKKHSGNRRFLRIAEVWRSPLTYRSNIFPSENTLLSVPQIRS